MKRWMRVIINTSAMVVVGASVLLMEHVSLWYIILWIVGWLIYNQSTRGDCNDI